MPQPDSNVSLALQRHRESHLQLRTFMQQSGQPVAMLDLDWRYLAYSSRWLEVFGLTGQELQGEPLLNTLPEFAQFEEVLRAAMGGSLQSREEDLLVRADGRKMWLRWQTRPWHTAEGDVGGVSMILEDITERVQAREQLAESERFLRMLLDMLPQSIFWKDARGRFLGVNRSFHAATGVSDIIGRSDYEMPWSREQSDFFRDCDLHVMQTRQPLLNIIERLTVSSGETRWLSTSKIPLVDSLGKVTGILGTFLDITHVKLMESDAAVRFERIVEGLQAPLQQLARLCQSLDESSTDYSPADLSQSLKECADSFLEQIRRAQQLPLIASADMQVEFDVEETVVSVLELLSLGPRANTVELLLDGPPAGLRPLLGHPSWLHQILTQWLGDALEAVDEGARLILRIGYQTHRLLWSLEAPRPVALSDNSRTLVGKLGGEVGKDGCSFQLPLGDRTPLDEPRFESQLQVAVVSAQTGLRQLLQQQLERWGIACLAQSAPGGELPRTVTHLLADVEFWLQPGHRAWLGNVGARVAVALATYEQRSHLSFLRSHGVQAFLMQPLCRPRLLAQVLQARWNTELAAPSAPLPLPFTGKRVLVADDTVEVQELLGRMLRAQGCTVEFASNGLEALQLVQQQGFDLVLLDCVMPELDGYEAAAAMRQNPLGRNLPIVGLTGQRRRAEEERCLAAGMDDCLLKPVQSSDLQAVLLARLS